MDTRPSCSLQQQSGLSGWRGREPALAGQVTESRSVSCKFSSAQTTKQQQKGAENFGTHEDALEESTSSEKKKSLSWQSAVCWSVWKKTKSYRCWKSWLRATSPDKMKKAEFRGRNYWIIKCAVFWLNAEQSCAKFTAAKWWWGAGLGEGRGGWGGTTFIQGAFQSLFISEPLMRRPANGCWQAAGLNTKSPAVQVESKREENTPPRGALFCGNYLSTARENLTLCVNLE